MRADALFDFQAENSGELSFYVGDIINLLEYPPGEEWWKGEVNGNTGYFPSNYVSIRKN